MGSDQHSRLLRFDSHGLLLIKGFFAYERCRTHSGDKDAFGQMAQFPPLLGSCIVVYYSYPGSGLVQGASGLILPDAADRVRLVGRELKEHLEGTPLQTSTQARVDGPGVGMQKQATMLGEQTCCPEPGVSLSIQRDRLWQSSRCFSPVWF